MGKVRGFNIATGGLSFEISSTGVDRMYNADSTADSIIEIDVDTKLNINNVFWPTSAFGVGGMGLRLYFTDTSTLRIYEIDLDTLLSISNSLPPQGGMSDIGGTQSRLFCVGGVTTIYELDPDTKLVITTTVIGAYDGIGGILTRLYVSSGTTDQLLEIDTDTKLPINTVTSPTSGLSRGIGGTTLRLYVVDGDTDRIYEIDPDTLLSLSFASAPGSNPRGVGGVKIVQSLIITELADGIISFGVIEYNSVDYTQ